MGLEIKNMIDPVKALKDVYGLQMHQKRVTGIRLSPTKSAAAKAG